MSATAETAYAFSVDLIVLVFWDKQINFTKWPRPPRSRICKRRLRHYFIPGE